MSLSYSGLEDFYRFIILDVGKDASGKYPAILMISTGTVYNTIIWCTSRFTSLLMLFSPVYTIAQHSENHEAHAGHSVRYAQISTGLSFNQFNLVNRAILQDTANQKD